MSRDTMIEELDSHLATFEKVEPEFRAELAKADPHISEAGVVVCSGEEARKLLAQLLEAGESVRELRKMVVQTVAH